MRFLPREFTIPEAPRADEFFLTPLRADHVVLDYEAVMNSHERRWQLFGHPPAWPGLGRGGRARLGRHRLRRGGQPRRRERAGRRQHRDGAGGRGALRGSLRGWPRSGAQLRPLPYAGAGWSACH